MGSITVVRLPWDLLKRSGTRTYSKWQILCRSGERPSSGGGDQWRSFEFLFEINKRFRGLSMNTASPKFQTGQFRWAPVTWVTYVTYIVTNTTFQFPNCVRKLLCNHNLWRPATSVVAWSSPLLTKPWPLCLLSHLLFNWSKGPRSRFSSTRW